MRERAALFGGTLDAGRRDGRGFEVRAVLPYPARSPVSRLRVVIADDQPLMRAGFRAVLEATGAIEVVAEAGDGEEAIRAAEAHRPDVVLMDIRMPGSTGSRRRGGCRASRVLILTTFGLDDYIVDALRAGASGFLSRTRRPPNWSRRPRGRGGRRPALARGHAPPARPGRRAAARAAASRAGGGSPS